MSDIKYEYKYDDKYVRECSCCGVQAPLHTFGEGRLSGDEIREFCEFCASSLVSNMVRYPDQYGREAAVLGGAMAAMFNVLADQVTGRSPSPEAGPIDLDQLLSGKEYVVPQDRTFRPGRSPAAVHVDIINLSGKDLDIHIKETLKRKSQTCKNCGDNGGHQHCGVTNISCDDWVHKHQALIDAHESGAEIEFEDPGGPGIWSRASIPAWDHPENYNFRLKPKEAGDD